MEEDGGSSNHAPVETPDAVTKPDHLGMLGGDSVMSPTHLTESQGAMDVWSQPDSVHPPGDVDGAPDSSKTKRRTRKMPPPGSQIIYIYIAL